MKFEKRGRAEFLLKFVKFPFEYKKRTIFRGGYQFCKRIHCCYLYVRKQHPITAGKCNKIGWACEWRKWDRRASDNGPSIVRHGVYLVTRNIGRNKSKPKF